MKLIYIFTIAIACLTARSQSIISSNEFSSIQKDSLTIQYIDLRNNQILFTEINNYIERMIDSSSLFRAGFGYITIGGVEVNPPPTIDVTDSFPVLKKEILISFTVGLSSSVLIVDKHSTSFSHNSFPLYYSFVKNRLVLIYDATTKWINRNNYSKDSKRQIAQLVEKSLRQAFDSTFVFESFRRKKYVLSTTERSKLSRQSILENAAFTLNMSRVFFLYTDGTKAYQYYK